LHGDFSQFKNAARTARMALPALRRNVMRSSLTCLGSIIGIAAVIAMMEIGGGSSRSIQQAIASLGASLFVGCRRPARLVAFDTGTGKSVTDLAISGDTDDLCYDAALKRIYISCGEGFIDVIDQRDPDHYHLRDRIPSRIGAHTSFFSAELNEFYLAVPQRSDQEAEIRVFHPQN